MKRVQSAIAKCNICVTSIFYDEWIIHITKTYVNMYDTSMHVVTMAENIIEFNLSDEIIEM